MQIKVLPLWTKNPPGIVISTVSKAKSGFSPFLLGPCNLYDGYVARNMENAWQFSKVYPEHIVGSEITEDYWTWAKNGWASTRAHRYPMGKGRIPLFSLWKDERLDYITARKTIYAPLYIQAVKDTQAFKNLKELYDTGAEITLLDYDAYDHQKLGMSLTDVLNNTTKKMGHAFVLAMLLTNDPALSFLT